LFPAEQQRITRLLIERVQLHGHGLDIVWREDGWIGLGAPTLRASAGRGTEHPEEALA
jgi:site-specific DNA recombinase